MGDGSVDRLDLLARSLEERYREALRHKFPHDDFRRLCTLYPQTERFLRQGVVPDLDMYLSFIAGYSCSATQLGRRPAEEIRTAIPKLRLSFFEAHPQYRELEPLIEPNQFAELYWKLRRADEFRRDLLIIMEGTASVRSHCPR